MTPLRKRILATAAIASLAVFAAAGPASAAAASGGAKLGLGALAFSADTVDTTAGSPSGSAVDLKWTVTDKDAVATEVHGTVELRLFNGDTAVGPTRSYRWQLQPGGSGDVYADDWSQPTAQQSSYTLNFVVPQYGPAEHVTWRVTKLTVADDHGNTRSFGTDKLAAFDSTVAVTELVDTEAPVLQMFGRSWEQRPELYADGRELTFKYTVSIQDQAGFWKGRVKLRGPGGVRVVWPFQLVKVDSSTSLCGDFPNYDNHAVWCELSFTLPQGSPAGVWHVAGVELTDVAGNSATREVDAETSDVHTTANSPLSASGFALSATEVNNWRQDQTFRLSLRPAGAEGAITSVRAYGDCWQMNTTPEAAADGTVSVELMIMVSFPDCHIDGVAVEDAAGNLALYGTQFGNADLGLRVRRAADTTAPAVAGAVLSRTTAPSSELYSISAKVTLESSEFSRVQQYYSFTFYDEQGRSIGGGSGWVEEGEDGTVTIETSLYNPPPGVYTGGFILVDAAGNSAAYGRGYDDNLPIPGRPLVLTVTEG
ncbi:hypothetical protein [Catellatospora tritici]|uniref:hypothetical protein n=1 Tax=Catellatospora tritici TaxID=2851566 RepID=UPI001C2D6ED6|nr:hypothetical protein [Catellatospora tritici]MBV1852249.1 hypothetical protein [Catellatospora tritici]